MLESQQAFLRRLDNLGVVQPSRSSGGQRRYTRNEITVVQYVVRLAGGGMTLPAIRRICTWSTGSPSCRRNATRSGRRCAKPGRWPAATRAAGKAGRAADRTGR